jgi:hypothetical protein
MKPTMKKTLLAATLGLTFNVATPAAHASLVLTFTDSTASAAIPGACSSIAWTAGAEFRFCDLSNVALAGGVPLQKDTIIGGETYTFNDAGVMTGVTGTPGNLGTTSFGTASFPGSAAPAASTNPTWQQNAFFYGAAFSLLAPVQGSLAGSAYGPATYIGGTPANGTLIPFIHAPVLEMQWAGTWFPLGQASGGVTFIADISNVVTLGNTTTFDFHMFANEFIDPAEDPLPACCGGYTAQWHQQGSGAYTAPVPIPAAVWLFGSGVLGLAGFARRKKAS